MQIWIQSAQIFRLLLKISVDPNCECIYLFFCLYFQVQPINYQTIFKNFTKKQSFVQLIFPSFNDFRKHFCFVCILFLDIFELMSPIIANNFKFKQRKSKRKFFIMIFILAQVAMFDLMRCKLKANDC